MQRLRRAIAVRPKSGKRILCGTRVLLRVAEIGIPGLRGPVLVRSGLSGRLPERGRLRPSRKLGLGMGLMLPMTQMWMSRMRLMRMPTRGRPALCGRRLSMWQRIIVPCHRSEPPSHIPDHPIQWRDHSSDAMSTCWASRLDPPGHRFREFRGSVTAIVARSGRIAIFAAHNAQGAPAVRFSLP